MSDSLIVEGRPILAYPVRVCLLLADTVEKLGIAGV